MIKGFADKRRVSVLHEVHPVFGLAYVCRSDGDANLKSCSPTKPIQLPSYLRRIAYQIRVAFRHQLSTLYFVLAVCGINHAHHIHDEMS